MLTYLDCLFKRESKNTFLTFAQRVTFGIMNDLSNDAKLRGIVVFDSKLTIKLGVTINLTLRLYDKYNMTLGGGGTVPPKLRFHKFHSISMYVVFNILYSLVGQKSN